MTAFRSINFDRNAWKALSGAGSLQVNCNRSGFNTQTDSGGNFVRARIGIIGNNEANCLTPDSSIGFGRAGDAGGQDNNNSCGNEAFWSADNGDVRAKNYGYIMVR